MTLTFTENLALVPVRARLPSRFFAKATTAWSPFPERHAAKVAVFFFGNASTGNALVFSEGQEWWKATGQSVPALTLAGYGNPELQGIAARWPDSNASKNPVTSGRGEGAIETVLEQVYALSSVDDLESASDLVVDYVDRLLDDGAFATCDELLSKVEVRKIPTTLMRALLAVTLPAKSRLLSRKNLYEEINVAMVRLRGAETTERLIGRLA